MSTLSPMEQERLFDLLADRAVGELAPADAGELDALLARVKGQPGYEAGSDNGYEELIGGLLLAADRPEEGEMPASLRSRLQARGQGLIGDAGPAGRIGSSPGVSAAPSGGRADGRAGGASGGGWMGWVAAAAAIVLAAIGWLRPPVAPGMAPEPSVSQRLAALEAEPDTVIIDLAGQGELADTGKAGEIVWNPRLQQGFLRLSALPSNDPTDAQYQLWIFDGTRDVYAVDGGVFNVSRPSEAGADGEEVVPFTPKLGVGQAAAFAVTRERPGGVVVTDQSGLVLLAPVPTDG